MGGDLTARELVWLFFGFSGRVSRKAYFLSGLLLFIIQVFLLYRFMAVPEDTTESSFWALAFTTVAIISVFSNIALTAKRLHDIDKPGWLAALFLVAGFFMYVFLCLVPGNPGPNQYGAATNAPA